MPCDSGRPFPHENLDITDDEIHEWVVRVTAVTPYLTLLVDCCNSGTIARGSRIRGIAPGDSPPQGWRQKILRRWGRKGRLRSGLSGWLPLGLRYTLLAACRNDQQARELEVVEEGGAIQGALTRALLDTLEELPPKATWRDLFERVAPQVTERFRDQEPQLEGEWDREIFGTGRHAPMPHVPVLARDGRGILESGAACGVREGSLWTVYPLGTRSERDGVEPLGLVEVTKVRAVTSEIRVIEETRPGALAEGGRAVESSLPPPDLIVPVEIVTTEESPRVLDLIRELEASRLLRMARPGESGAMRVSRDREAWVVEEDGQPARVPQIVRDSRRASFLVGNLETRARYLNGLSLLNPESPLTGQVELRLYRRDGQLVVLEEGVFREGEVVIPEVVNRTESDLYVYLLDFGLTGRIELLYPPPGEKKALTRRESLRIGEREAEKISLYFPEGAPGGGLETFKLFATTHPAEFRRLTQPEFRASIPTLCLDRLLAAAGGGGGIRRFGILDTGEDWTTVECTFRLVP